MRVKRPRIVLDLMSQYPYIPLQLIRGVGSNDVRTALQQILSVFRVVYSVRLLFHPLFPIGRTLRLQRHVQTYACRLGVESQFPFFSLFHEHDVFCTHHEHRR